MAPDGPWPPGTPALLPTSTSTAMGRSSTAAGGEVAFASDMIIDIILVLFNGPRYFGRWRSLSSPVAAAAVHGWLSLRADTTTQRLIGDRERKEALRYRVRQAGKGGGASRAKNAAGTDTTPRLVRGEACHRDLL